MRAAPSLEEYATAWQDFIERLAKLWIKAEKECQPFRARFQPWQGRFKAIRDSDELLRYLHQARHADQHSIQPMTQEVLGQLMLSIPPLGTVEVQLDPEKGKLKIIGECSFALNQNRGYMLLPIVNRSVTYNPPTEYLGEKLSRNDPLLVAEKGLAFYEDFLRQVEAEFFPAAVPTNNDQTS
jgi:hypothetical protein